MKSNFTGRKRNPSVFLVLGFVLIFLCAGGIFWQVTNLMNWTVSEFGPPSPALNRTDMLVYSYRLLVNQDELNKPVDPRGKEKTFEVGLGESISSIAKRLQDVGLIRSADAFRYYLIYSGKDTGVQAGKYKLSPALNAIAITQSLQDATPRDVVFRILPGWRVEEIADALPTSGLNITKKDFLKKVKDPAQFQPLTGLDGLSSLEGILFPQAYTVYRQASVDDLITLFIGEFNARVTKDLRHKFADQHLNLIQAVTLASIIQKEAVVEEEQPEIASVFFNRLSAGIKLESDPTTQYALGYNNLQKTWWTNPLSSNDLSVQSPYNTYVAAGLPPGPICNPGISALRAVAYPAKTNYLFFRARCDGSGYHNFSTTFEEHAANACP